jgi:DNA polymerase-3 subunit beta
MEEKVIFKAPKGELLNNLVKVSKIVKDKSIMPECTQFLFEVSGDSLNITGTNREIWIESGMPVSESSGDLSFCVDKTIMDVLKNLPEQPVTIEVARETRTIPEDRKAMSSVINITHASGIFQINGLDDTLYPRAKKVDGNRFKLPVSNIKRGILKTVGFAANDSLRPVMNGVFFDIKGDRVAFVSSDGLAISRFEDLSLTDIRSESIILGSETVNILKFALDSPTGETIEITSGENSVAFKYKNLEITSRLICGKYVNYNSVFPENPPISATVNRHSLSAALKRLLIVYESEAHPAIINISLSGMSLSMGPKINESLECTATGEIRIGIHPKYILNILDVIDGDNIIMSFVDQNKPITITPEYQEDNTLLTFLSCPTHINRER